MKNINSYSPEQECHADLYGEPCSGQCDICRGDSGKAADVQKLERYRKLMDNA